MSYACYHCGRRIRGQVMHVVPPLIAIHCGDFPKAYHPVCYERAEAEAEKELHAPPAFALTGKPKPVWQRGTFESAKAAQRPLFAGLGCLPGQGDLFATDGEG